MTHHDIIELLNMGEFICVCLAVICIILLLHLFWK